jgi:LysR family hydrogen peroxide-inducible transcriptional activator
MISIQQMQYILVLSEQKQFQRASELCFVTQPTLSMQVKKAEEDLGYAIFDRSKNPIELTIYGMKLIPLIRDVLNETGKIEVLTKKFKGIYKEQVRIGIIPTIASYLVADMFALWQEKLKGIQLIILEQKTEELLVSIERKELDMAILAGPFNDSKMRTIRLFREEILAYCPSLKSKTILTNDLIELHPWLLSKGNCLRTQMIQFCEIKEDNETDSWNYEGGNIELLMKMVELNGGYTLVPKNYHLSEHQRKQLRSIKTRAGSDEAVPAREIIAISPNKTLKWNSLDALIREIQVNYNKENEDLKMTVLDWNG